MRPNRQQRGYASSKSKPWCVVLTRPGYVPQVIGAFERREYAQEWVRNHVSEYRHWRFSTAPLALVPTAPIKDQLEAPLARIQLRHRLTRKRRSWRERTDGIGDGRSWEDQ